MSIKGPHRHPQAALQARGSRFSTRPDPPQLPRKRYTAPDWLSDLGKQEWDRIHGFIYKWGLLTEMSLQFWAGYCESYAQFRQADTELRELQKKPDVTPLDFRRVSAIRNDFFRVCMQALRQTNVAPYLAAGAGFE